MKQRTDSLGRDVIVGDQVAYKNQWQGYRIGRIENFTKGGNPRVVDYDNHGAFDTPDKAHALIYGFIKIEPV